GCATGDGFIGVDVLARVAAKELLDLLLHLGHAGHTADEDYIVNIAGLDTGVFDGDAAGLDGALHQVFHQSLELGTGDLQIQVLRTAGIRRDVRQVDFGLLSRGELDLRLFSSFLQTLEGQNVFGQINAAFFLELVNDVVDDALVEVFAAKESVAIGGKHFELLLAIQVG